VGKGELLKSVLNSNRAAHATITAIDTDLERLRIARSRYCSSEKASTIRFRKADFLKWGAVRARNESVDAVVMNPPFNARGRSLVSVREICNRIGLEDFPERAPIESAFVLTSLGLLRDGGTLLSVLPSSIISADRSRWIRQALLTLGTFRCVHELPESSFPGIESRVYLVAFRKEQPGRRVQLMNHDLLKPYKMCVPVSDLADGQRLDYAFYASSDVKNRLERRSSLGWCRLGHVAEVRRGGAEPPSSSRAALHSSRYRCATWGNVSDFSAAPLHLYGCRVGRSCSQRFGIGKTRGLSNVTDCVFRLAPMNPRQIWKILFSIRCLMSVRSIAESLERGTGAKYIGATGLRNLAVPLSLASAYPSHFRRFRSSIISGNAARLSAVESEVATLLTGSTLRRR